MNVKQKVHASGDCAGSTEDGGSIKIEWVTELCEADPAVEGKFVQHNPREQHETAKEQDKVSLATEKIRSALEWIQERDRARAGQVRLGWNRLIQDDEFDRGITNIFEPGVDTVPCQVRLAKHKVGNCLED